MAVGSATPGSVSIPAISANQEAAPLREAELEKVKQHLKRCTQLGAAPGDAIRLVCGKALLCALVFCLGAAPQYLPLLYLAFASVGLPWRIWTFCKKGWGFFLVDFCYVSHRGLAV